MIYAFDLDGTLCSTPVGKYDQATPYKTRINLVNHLYDSGHTIKIFTARGSTTNINWRNLTENQLKSWGVKYHALIFGKPQYDILIDDKATHAKTFFNNIAQLWG